ncbi:hypothetical protein [Mycetocola zhadangensis]|uniref:DUF7847 domain-containing protein n=1 Tax=Mycetocola zhadangensis TaxID=1164595 RepID=A0A3L7IW99_9MICO|nr:hypothetical protein [Mycetocola zhadangensis]RLQ81503.1 hypothetical protein D9V28_14245 [Mycetocola zhadangensis]RLQ82457.1 hypothetical protein D9V28_10755 [Mycetocola zhadangensis]GGF01166.1 hypothetical protein GCM10011313_25250 [Mycetocola zhadangensis]
MTHDQNWQAPGSAEEPPRYGERVPQSPPAPQQAPQSQQPPAGQPQQYPQVNPPSGANPYGQNPYPSQPSGQGQYGQNPWGQQPYGAPQFSQPGWTPPPKPGLIPLRPLGFGTLLGAPFLALKRNPKATFGSALLVQAISVVISLLVIGAITFFFVSRISSASAEDQDAIAAGGVAAILLGALIPFLITLIGTVFLQGVIVNEVARSTLGEKLTLKAVWKATWPRFGHLLLWVLVATVAFTIVLAVLVGIVWMLVVLGGGFIAAGIILAILAGIALIVVGVWLSIKLSIVPSVIVLERASMGAAIRRSWRLTDGYFWRTLGVQYLIAFIVGTVSQVVLTPVSVLYVMALSAVDPTGTSAESWVGPLVLYAIMIVLSLLVGSITSVVSSAAIALIYVDLRMRKEGLDLELIRFVEARQTGNATVEDPYLLQASGRPTPMGQAGPAGSGSPWA